jgi:hypothetical protein
MRVQMKSSARILMVVSVSLALPGLLNGQSANRKTQEQKPAPSAAIKFQPLDVKPGLWETTITVQRVGQMPISPEMLAKLSPEQRARIEARMKASSGASSSTYTDRNCVTKEDLADGNFGQSKGECTQTLTNSSSSKASGTATCNVEGMEVKGSLEIEAVDQEHIKGSTHGMASGAGNTRTVDTTFVSTWLGANCKKGE